MKKAEAQRIAREMAEEAYKTRPGMDYAALENYLMTEDMRARTERGVDWKNHTTFQAEYRKRYQELKLAASQP